MPEFGSRLQEGERLLWQGQPDPSLFNRPRVIAYALLLLPCMPLIVWAFGQKFGLNLPFLSPLTFGIALGSWPIACWLVAIYAEEQTPWAAYGLTDRRIMIRRLHRLTSQETRPRIEEYPLGMLTPRLRPARAGSGTITFGFPAWHYEQAFRAIPDVAVVFAQLTEARAALAPTDASRPYYVNNAPSPPPTVGVEAYLQRGETIFWQGRMDAETYWRIHRIAVFVLHLLIVAAIGTFLAAANQWTPFRQALGVVPAAVLFPIWKAWALRSATRSDYVLTNRRVLTLKTLRRRQRRLEERDLAETYAMRLVEGRRGVGTIIFERKTQGKGTSAETYEYSFQHIPQAQAVFEMITMARSQAANKQLPVAKQNQS